MASDGAVLDSHDAPADDTQESLEPDTSESARVASAPLETRPMSALAGHSLAAEDALAAPRVEIGPDCPCRCKLCTLGRRQVVFGVGNPRADLMFVGEAPGDEDVQGEPFVGRAGQLLTKIIEAIDLRREDVYIANVIKCRPPQNRNPEPDEVAECEPFLFRQIDMHPAARDRRAGQVRGAVAAEDRRAGHGASAAVSSPTARPSLIPTYHPAYLLRNPPAKREVWEDRKRVKAILTQGAGV